MADKSPENTVQDDKIPSSTTPQESLNDLVQDEPEPEKRIVSKVISQGNPVNPAQDASTKDMERHSGSIFQESSGNLGQNKSAEDERKFSKTILQETTDNPVQNESADGENESSAAMLQETSGNKFQDISTEAKLENNLDKGQDDNLGENEFSQEEETKIISQGSPNSLKQDESTKNTEKPSGLMFQESTGHLGQDESADDEKKTSRAILQEILGDLVQNESAEGELESSKAMLQETSHNKFQDISSKDLEKASGAKLEENLDKGQNESAEDEKKSFNIDKLGQDDFSEEDENFEKAPEERKSEFEKQIKNIFVRPSHLEPRHPLFSSPFVKRIAAKAFGPKKPKWYTPLTSAQMYLFKELVNFIEIGRRGTFRFNAFMEALQDFVPGISRAEVVGILENMERNEFQELDFGKFLFLLAYEDHPDVKDKDDTKKTLFATLVTPRQCLILSAISFYVLIAMPEDIKRYYGANAGRKTTILHYHMEASRLVGLTEKQMQKKLKKANQNLEALYLKTGSPYAAPVPTVPLTKKPRKLSKPRTGLPMKKVSVPRPIKPVKQSRKLGSPVTYKTKDDKMFYDMHYGRVPMPTLEIPKKMRQQINEKCTVEHKDYITKKAYEAVSEYRGRLKEATVLYNNRSLDYILKKGFPTIADEENFIKLYEKYMPLKMEDVKNFSLWVKPADYELKHDGKPLYPDNFAFGKKIP